MTGTEVGSEEDVERICQDYGVDLGSVFNELLGNVIV